MKKSIRNLIVLATVGICIFSFIPAVMASQGRVTKRPLDNWLDPNYNFFSWGLEENWAFGDYMSPYSGLVCKMGFPWPASNDKAGFGPFVFDMVYENSLVEGDTIIDGHITERELNNGEALITLHLDVKNAPCTVYDFFEFIGYCLNNTVLWPHEGIPPSAILGEGIDGYIDYKVVCKFIIGEPGAELPTVWDMNYISINIVGTGYGTLTEHAADYGFTPGALGMVKLHQIVLYKPDLNGNPLKYYPDYGELWPLETIEIHEIG